MVVVGKKSRIRINITALYAFIPGTGTVINLDCCLVPSHRGISLSSRGPTPLHSSPLSGIFIDTETSTLRLAAPGRTCEDNKEILRDF